MPKSYPVEMVQPMGSHNSPYPCIKSEHLKKYLNFPFEFLNPVQSDFVPYLEDYDTNIVLAAPTSSGKTICIEYFISEAIINHGKRALYIAPMKALADEKFEEWTNPSHTFSKYKVEIQTGDFELTEEKKKRLLLANIIILTPEMFNSKCRFYSQHDWLKNTVFIGDEIHLIGMRERGDALEVGLIQYFENDLNARALFVSATIPNAEDFKAWLEHLTGKKAVYLLSNYRPCKLNIKWSLIEDTNKGGRGASYAEKEVNRLQTAIREIQKYEKESVLVFVGSKDFGHKLSKQLNLINIKTYFHNADEDRESRKKIEKDFKDGTIKVLVSTTTLAWGCLTPNTQIILENKIKSIENINKDDLVISSGVVSEDITDNVKKSVMLLEHEEKEYEIYRITLDNGLSVECTGEHVIPVVGNKHKEVCELNTKDYLFVNNSYLPKKEQKNINIEQAYFIGAISGDGWFSENNRKYHPVIVCENKIYRENIYNLAKKINIYPNISQNSYGTYQITLSKGKEFISFLSENISYVENSAKKIDYNLIYSEEEILFSILAGLIDTDGGIEDNKICFYNTSYHLINFFVLAMRRFSIPSKIRCRKAQQQKYNGHIINSKKTCYELYFGSRKAIEFFYENIMKYMFHKEKIDKLKRRYYGSFKRLKKDNSYFNFGFFHSKRSHTFMIDFINKASNLPIMLTEVLKDNKLKRLPIRNNYLNCIFDIEEKKFMGRKRKHYKTKDFIINAPTDNKTQLCKYLIENCNFIPDKEFNIKKQNKMIEKYKIKNIEKYKLKTKVYDLDIQDPVSEEYRHYYANNILVHNCNTPARYVIISHTAFGLTPMEPANIHQSMGRAGRAGYSSEGDAIILCEKRKKNQEEERIFKGYKVLSTLNDVNTLCFHILSYIVNGNIKNCNDLLKWYNKTLASIQNSQINQQNAQKVLDNLCGRGMIKVDKNTGEYVQTKLGEITARMYMSPLDVSDWFKNFSRIKYINPPKNCSKPDVSTIINLNVASAFAECFQWGKTWFKGTDGEKDFQAPSNAIYISKREADCESVKQIGVRLGKDPLTNPHLKYVAAFSEILNGEDSSPELMSISYNITKDCERIIQTMKQIDDQIGKHVNGAGKCDGFGWGNEWDILGSRLKYGVGIEMIDLVKIDGIGRAFAKKLYDNNIKNEKDLKLPINESKVVEILGKNRSKKILDSI